MPSLPRSQLRPFFIALPLARKGKKGGKGGGGNGTTTNRYSSPHSAK